MTHLTFTTYDDLRECIHRALDRDGKHDWDETARLADVLAPTIWNELIMFPLESWLTHTLTHTEESVKSSAVGGSEPS